MGEPRADYFPPVNHPDGGTLKKMAIEARAIEDAARACRDEAISDDDRAMVCAALLLEMAHKRANGLPVEWDDELASDIASWESAR